jgi:hypothetical protein
LLHDRIDICGRGCLVVTHGGVRFIGDSSEIHRRGLGSELGARSSGGFTFLSPGPALLGGGAPSRRYTGSAPPRGAYLIQAGPTAANLQDAELTGANITQEQLDTVQYPQGATMPDE